MGSRFDPLAIRHKEIGMRITAHAALNPSATLNIAGGALELHENQYLHMRDSPGWTIKVVTGTIWITQESDSRDIVLKDGNSFVLDRKGSALVRSLSGANICLKSR